MKMIVTLPGGHKVNAKYKDHIIKTDQPKNAEGDDSAPAPFALFIGSIATCTGYYVLSFCKKRAISTDKIKIELDTQRDAETKLISKIKIEIKLGKDFPEKYKNAVIHAANLCSVKKHLQNPPEFKIYTT